MPDDIQPKSSRASLNEAINRIYQGVLTLPYAEFKELTLRQLREVLAFDSGVWASGAHSTNTIHSVALVDHAPEMLMNYALNWQAHDFVRAAAVAEPGVAFRNEDVMALADYHRTDIYREFSSPAGIEHALGLVHADPAADLGEMLFLFRADPAAAYSDAERDRLQLLMPHLATAWRQRQALAAHETSAVLPGRSHAVIDDDGRLQAADSGFSGLLRSAFPDWTGPLLPAEVRMILQPGTSELTAAGLDFHLMRSPGRSVLSAGRRDDQGLTPAEMRVARLFADGASHGEVAAKLGVRPATVRNQLTSIYRKLDIHSKAELARRFPPSGG
ncbi:LuxR C-terminal-related transcriptional regulator [Phenylobacterium sp. LjRoot164]|uniref:helix-turn-helix transcriptional regulator n=1 Tax=unclassified Phenylobacterium TaxID=2640670 RepID=UPI003ECC478B